MSVRQRWKPRVFHSTHILQPLTSVLVQCQRAFILTVFSLIYAPFDYSRLSYTYKI